MPLYLFILLQQKQGAVKTQMILLLLSISSVAFDFVNLWIVVVGQVPKLSQFLLLRLLQLLLLLLFGEDWGLVVCFIIIIIIIIQKATISFNTLTMINSFGNSIPVRTQIYVIVVSKFRILHSCHNP
jgi:hypothetical protein